MDEVDQLSIQEGMGSAVVERLVNALRHTIIMDIDLDHVPSELLDEWKECFSGIRSYNGLSFDENCVLRVDDSSCTLEGSGRVDNETLKELAQLHGLSGHFKFRFESPNPLHDDPDAEIGIWPGETWFRLEMDPS